MPIFKNYNKNFFKKWSPDMAYVLGFLYADGNIMKTKRGTHFISFYSADEYIIVKMREALMSEHKITKCISNSSLSYKLQIGSKEFFKDLVDIGLIPNKTNRMKLPNIPQVFVGDFVRGYFDGDGNVWTGLVHKERNNPLLVLQVVFTSCSLDFLKALKGLLASQGIKGGSVYKVRQGNYGRLLFSTLDALKLHEIMYNSPCSIFLDRKRVIFEKFQDMRL